MVTTSGETRRKGIMLTSTPRFLKEHMDAGSNPVLTTQIKIMKLFFIIMGIMTLVMLIDTVRYVMTHKEEDK